MLLAALQKVGRRPHTPTGCRQCSYARNALSLHGHPGALPPGPTKGSSTNWTGASGEALWLMYNTSKIPASWNYTACCSRQPCGKCAKELHSLWCALTVVHTEHENRSQSSCARHAALRW